MYILLTGYPPFGGRDNKTIMQKILKGEYKTEPLKKRCKACIDLISKLLEKDINTRIRADTALNHKWFQIYKSKEIRVDIDDPKIIQKYINNLKNYEKSNNINEFALAYLIHNHPELEEIDLATKLFAKIDKKGNGKITRKTWQRVPQECHRQVALCNHGVCIKSRCKQQSWHILRFKKSLS
jgi:calcium-dependent protein kinase